VSGWWLLVGVPVPLHGSDHARGTRNSMAHFSESKMARGWVGGVTFFDRRLHGSMPCFLLLVAIK